VQGEVARYALAEVLVNGSNLFGSRGFYGALMGFFGISQIFYPLRENWQGCAG
jgi:hypothetical protein